MKFHRSILMTIATSFQEHIEAFVQTMPAKQDYDGQDGFVTADIETPDYNGVLRNPALVLSATNYYDDGDHHREVTVEILEPEIGNSRLRALVTYTAGDPITTRDQLLFSFNHPAYNRDDEQRCAQQIGAALALDVVISFLNFARVPNYTAVQDLLSKI